MSRGYELDKPTFGIYDSSFPYSVADHKAIAGRIDFLQNATLGL